MAERVVPRRGLALRAYALASVAFALKNPVTTMGPFGGFGNASAGSEVEWDVPEAKVFFNDLATDKPLPKNLITGASVAGTT